MTTEYQDTAHISGASLNCTPTVTDTDGSIYLTWVDANLACWVARIKDGREQTKMIWSDVKNDPYHMGSSIGMDRNGYLHAVCNHHGSPYNYEPGGGHYDHAWQYWISDRPRSVDSFSFAGDGTRSPAGTFITYAGFYGGVDRPLYLSFRHQVASNTDIRGEFNAGAQAAGIARYEEDRRAWVSLGGSDHAYRDSGFPYRKSTSDSVTWFWNHSGIPGRPFYNGYNPDLLVEPSGKIHAVTAVNDGDLMGPVARSGSAASHVIYSYSDDEGETWRRASGQVIPSKPITLATADVVVGPEWTYQKRGTEWRINVGVEPDGSPILSWHVWGLGAYISQWTGSKWTDPRRFEAAANVALFESDSDGNLWTVVGDQLRRSTDSGASWQVQASVDGAGFNLIESGYLYRTGNVRFLAYPGSPPWVCRLQSVKMHAENGDHSEINKALGELDERVSDFESWKRQ